MLCIPIIANDTEGAVKKIFEAREHADIVEARLDLMESFDLNEIICASTKPVIVTYRSQKEGGKGTLDPSAVADCLIYAAQSNAEFIDVELSMPAEFRDKIIQNKGSSRIIISTHIIDRTPAIHDLISLLNESVQAGGDIVKIVTMANTMDDNLKMLELVSESRKKGVEIIAFCMGSLGRMSRIFSLIMGGYLAFTSLETGEESAPGQIPVKEMRELLEYFAIWRKRK